MITRTTLALAAMLLLGIGAISPAANATPPTPISACGFTASTSGNYVVTTNLTATTGNCITITASDVTIDLQRHMITGSGAAVDGITDVATITSITNIIIANGNIRGFEYGIELDTATYVTISNINAMQNTVIGIVLGGNSTVSNSQANNNGYAGIQFENDNNTVNNSQANHNEQYGIGSAGSNLEVANSAANNNGGDGGIYCVGGDNTVSNSHADNNGNGGIYVELGGNNTIINSSANRNTGRGILIATGGNNTIINSPANGNTIDGIDIGASNNTITNSQASGNNGNGIDITGDDNLLTSDTVNRNGLVGLTLACPSNLFGNTAQGNIGGKTSPSPLTGCTLLDNNF